MKIFLTKWWCVLLCTCYIVPTYAQASPEEVPGEIQIYSPQAWDFMKYGNSEMKLYTGTINLDIPVYTYQDYDFTLPLSLKYASNGFMPNKIAGYVGMGWFLNIGGVITRKVNGIPDEASSVSYGDMENRLWYEYGYVLCI